MSLRPRLAILLLLAPLVTFADEPEGRTFSYAWEWIEVANSEPALGHLSSDFFRGSRGALFGLIKAGATSDSAYRRLADLDDALRARLVADLDRYDAGLRPVLDESLHLDVLTLAEFFGVRRPEAVPLLLRATAANQRLGDGFARARRLADQAFARPAEAPGVLRTLADVAAAGAPEPRAAALARLPADDDTVQAALASAVARAAAVGLGQFDDAKSLIQDRPLPPATLARAFTVALNSSVGATQRLRVLAAIGETGLLPRLPADNPLLSTIAVLGGQNPTPGGGADARRLVAAATVAVSIGEGLSPPKGALDALKSAANALRDILVPGLASTDTSEKLAAIRKVQLLGPDALAAYKDLLTPLLADPDHDVRLLAAQSLGDERSIALARVQDLLADCRADSPTLRETAARQLQELDLFPKSITAALLRAVAARDMAAREGLLRAIERAHAGESDPLLSLQSAADAEDSATRAYARAALRELAPAR